MSSRAGSGTGQCNRGRARRRAVDILGFRDGQIVSNWVGADWLGLFVQLGAVDKPWP